MDLEDRGVGVESDNHAAFEQGARSQIEVADRGLRAEGYAVTVPMGAARSALSEIWLSSVLVPASDHFRARDRSGRDSWSVQRGGGFRPAGEPAADRDQRYANDKPGDKPPGQAEGEES